MDISLLKFIPLFSELSDDDLHAIAQVSMQHSFRKDNMVLIEEEVGSTMFIILEGRVKISRISDEGREVILSIMSEGDFFGEMSILDGQARSANVVTLEDSSILVIHREDFLQMLHDFPQIAINLLKELAHRLRFGLGKRCRTAVIFQPRIIGPAIFKVECIVAVQVDTVVVKIEHTVVIVIAFVLPPGRINTCHDDIMAFRVEERNEPYLAVINPVRDS